MARTTTTPAGSAGRRGRSAGARLRHRALGAVSALAVALVGVGVVATAPAAVAATPAADQPTVSSDALPTVQVNGVVWDTAIIGNTVYVAGSFTSARPAGSPAGTNETPRGNLLAFDIRTGELIPSWAPTVNAAAFAITPSPDGTLLYVGGDFTAATSSGSTTSVGRTRVASFSATTGVLDTRVRPTPNAAVRAIVATPSTVYLGGNFTTVGGVDRPRVAAVSASTGALTTFRASVQRSQVDALLLTPDGSKLVIAGRFYLINNIATPGVGWVNATTGATVPFPANQVIQNSGMSTGFSAGITSLSLSGNQIIGAGFHRLDTGDGSIGNLEGMFAANATTGQVEWVADCRGDTYSTYPAPDGHIYLAGHPHDCSPLGGFPEATPRVHLYGLAFTQDARVTNGVGAGTAHAGRPSPALANWFPTFTAGTYTGQNQAGWTVTGNADYVVYGGEFPRVNGTAQAGLVRFAARPSTTAKRGPSLTGGNFTPAAVSRSAGTAQVSWPVNNDPDDGTLTYKLIRNGNTAAPVATVVHESRYWDRGRLSATDTGLANGTSYSYTVVVTDSSGNSVTSPAVTVTTAAASAGALSAYAKTVLADAPANYWRLGDTTATVNTWTGANPGTSTGVTRAVPGGISGDADGALALTGTSTSSAASGTAENSVNALSVEAWFSTTTQRGGKIVGFGSSRTGASATYDRQIVMGDDGRLTFGVNPRAIKTISSPTAYNDGRWHHVVATLGQPGMSLYVDGALVASDSTVSTGQLQYAGFWRIGGDALAGWNAGASSEYFAGSIDEVATYSRPLTGADVARHYSFGTTGTAPKIPPTAEFTATPDRLTVALDARASADADGTVASYDWDFGDGTTGTGATPSHVFRAAGTYRVTLTVTDDDGVKATTAQDVEVITGLPTAAFTSQASALVLSVDGSTSTDPDGTLTFAWSFGDGTTEAGVTATHTYAAPGTYPVTLTVTDDDGQRSTATQSVTVTNVAKVLGRDAFGRTSSTGFGSADLGGAWTTTAGAASVSGGAGALTLSGASSAAGARLPGAAGATTLTQVSTTFDKVPNGGGAYSLVRGRIAANGDEYRLKTQVSSAGRVTAWLAESVTGKETAITATATVPVTVRAGTTLLSKLAVTGSSPTQLTAKVWAAGTAEPADWTVTASSSTASLQTVGHVGLSAQNSSTTTNGPVTVRFDDFLATDGGSAVPQQAPTAAFTAQATNLTVAVDASASADGDGTVESYRWDFGDGTTASGRTSSRTYTAAGTYTVTLTVTDDTGLTGTTTRVVTVAPAPQPPTASFTTQVSGSGVAVDAAASTDPDGTIASYAWAWGDGTTGSGATASHTYAAGGSYTVTLTVTDGTGLTGTTTRTFTVSGPAPDPGTGTLGADAFGRTVTSGWGSADTGGAYVATAGAATVSGGAGLLTLAKANSAASARLPGASGTDVTTQVTVALDKVPNGAGVYGLVRARIAGNDDAYRMKTQHQANGQIKVWWTKSVAGTETTISSFNTAPGVTYAPGTRVVLKTVVTGTNPTRLQSKVWPEGGTEPTGWLHDFTDATASLQVPGHVGVWNQLSSSSTNGPVIVRYDDLTITGPAGTGQGGGTPAPQPQAPTASFTAQATDLALAVDGSGSTDADGTVTRYAWTFGDGGTATGATASHTYAAAGSYTVTLTVTDSSDLTATSSRTVTVTAPAPGPGPDPAPGVTTVAQDAFDRAVTSGFGSADTGGAWVATAGATSVAGGAGVLTLAGANSAASARLPGASGTDLTTTVKVSLDKVPNGSGSYGLVRGRIVANDDAYRMKLQYLATGQVKVWWTKSVGGVETTISSFNTAPGVTYAPGTVLVLKAAVTGTSPTRLQSKVWVDGTAEPTAWIHDFTDTTASLQAAGHVGVWQQLSSSTSNGPVRVRFDDLLVTSGSAQ